MGMTKDIGILILTHNAPHYVEKTLESLNRVTNPDLLRRCLIVVVDNASDDKTRDLLQKLEKKKYIDKLYFSEENTFFARGNNIAADLAGNELQYFLLLNSDVEIRETKWLERLISIKETEGYAAVSYGACHNPDRGDGYCFLVDTQLYMRYRIDEKFQWWGGATKLQLDILQGGGNILAIDDHDAVIYHYGGKSGKDFKKAGKLDDRYHDVLASFRHAPGKVKIVSLTNRKGPVVWVRKKMRKVVNLLKRV